MGRNGRRARPAAALALALACLVPAGTARATDPRNATVTLASIAKGFTSITSLVWANDGTGRLFVVQQNGYIRYRTHSGTIGTFLNISTRVSQDGGERGLLGMALPSSFPKDGRFFLDYTQPNGDIIIARYHVTPGSNRASTTEYRLLRIPHSTYANHNGGQLQFASDADLYIGVGDGGGAGDPGNNAQNRKVLLGKILRIDVNHDCSPHRYCIPSTNPYATSTVYRREIWHWGLRNPWRFSFDSATGKMWIGDVGQSSWEEVDVVPKATGGRNFGWNCYEGRAVYTSSTYCSGLSWSKPLQVYDHSNGRCAIIGGYVYRGATYSSIGNGIYVYGDYCSGEIWGLGQTSSGTWVNSLLDSSGLTLRTFSAAPTGELYAGAQNGTVYHVVWHAA